MKHNALFLLALTLCFSSCGDSNPIVNVKDLKGNTDEMKSNTQNLDQKMGKTNETMEQLRASMELMKETILVLSSQMGETNGQLASTNQNIVAMYNKLNDLYLQMTSMNTTTVSLLEEMVNLKIEMVSMSGTIGNMNTSMGGLDSKMAGMDKKMGGMNLGLKSMQDVLVKMTNTMAAMFLEVRTKEAEDTREKKITIIKDPSRGIGEKIAAAVIYFKSLEFQLWTGNKPYDDNIMREKLFFDATSEFYKRASDFYIQGHFTRNLDSSVNALEKSFELISKRPRILEATNSPQNVEFLMSNTDLGLHALAVAMHYNLHLQEEFYRRSSTKFEIISFYDIVTRAIQKDHSGAALTAAESVVVDGINLEITKALLQARLNMILALAISDVTGAQKIEIQMNEALESFGVGHLEQIKKELKLNDYGALFSSVWNKEIKGEIRLPSTFETANEATKKSALKKFDGAIEVIEILESIGETPQIFPKFKSILQNLTIFPQAQSSAQDGDTKRAQSDENKKLNATFYRCLSALNHIEDPQNSARTFCRPPQKL